MPQSLEQKVNKNTGWILLAIGICLEIAWSFIFPVISALVVGVDERNQSIPVWVSDNFFLLGSIIPIIVIIIGIRLVYSSRKKL
jgi:hypothetical protein